MQLLRGRNDELATKYFSVLDPNHGVPKELSRLLLAALNGHQDVSERCFENIRWIANRVMEAREPEDMGIHAVGTIL